MNPPTIPLLSVCTDLGLLILPFIEFGSGAKIVHFYQGNSGGVAYTADDGCVVARWQVRNNCRLACHSRSVATGLNIADLIAGDNPAEYRCLPVIICCNQCSSLVVQFQCRITQCVGDPMFRELRANGANDHRFWASPLNDKTTNHDMLPCLNKAAGTDVTKTCTGSRTQI